MSSSNEDIVKAIKSYQERLERYVSQNNNEKILYVLSKLRKLPIKTIHLEETGVGRTVNALKKLGDDVGEHAKDLVAHWKMMVVAEEQAAQEAANCEDNNDSTVDSAPDSSFSNYERNNSENSEQNHSNHHEPSNDEEDVNEEANNSSHSLSDTNKYYSDNDTSNKYKSEKKSGSSHKSKDEKHKQTEHVKDKYEKDKRSDRHSSKRKHESSSESEVEKKSKTSHNNSHKEKSHSKRKRDTSNSNDGDDYYDSNEKRKSKHRRESSSSDSNYKQNNSRSTREEKSSSKLKEKSSSDRKHKEERSGSKHNYDIKSDSNRNEYEEKSNRNEREKSDKKDHKLEHKKDRHSEKDSKSKHDSSKSSSRSDKDSSKSKSHHERNDKEKRDKEKLKKDESSDRHASHREKESKDNGSSDKVKETRDKDKVTKDKDKDAERKRDDEKSSHSKSKSTKEKSKSSSSSKHSSSNSNSHSSSKTDKTEKKNTENKNQIAPKNKGRILNGIDSESGASFAEALGMCEPVRASKKKKPVLNASSTSSVPPKGEKSSSIPSCSRIDDAELSDEKYVPELLKEQKLDPININLSSLLPEITPNYKPVALPIDQPKRLISEDEALSRVMANKNLRTKVYSGNKTVGKVESLFELCVRVLQDNIDALEYTGGVPFLILKPVLEKATPDQLFNMEHHNPYLIDDTDDLWNLHCQKEFRNKNREELESWRDMYMRCLDEREAKLNAITANIKQSQEKSIPVRTAKLAYIDSVAKPPRNIARKQLKNGIVNEQKQTMSAKLSALATAGEAGKVAVPNPGSRAAERSSNSSHSSSSSNMKPKKAPLMAKTLSFFKNRFKR